MSRTVFTANRQLFFKGWPPCLNVQASHLDIQNGDFSQPHAQGLAFRPPFFYQPAVPVVSKDKEPGLINN